MDTAARLLKLLSLLQIRRDWTGAELAERLGVTPRTIRRDVERLRELDYPVAATPGVAGGYRLGSGTALPPLVLDDDEAVAVAMGLRTAVGGTIAGIEETSVRALTKLEQVLPSRLRRRINALQSAVVPMPGGAPAVDPQTLTTIAAACRDHQRLHVDYRSAGGTASRRVVEPARLACTGRLWYLLAWDTGRGDWRTLRVDRITAAPGLGARFTPREPPEADIAGYVSRAISSAPYPYRAKVVVHAPAERVRERVTPASGMVEAVDEDSCVLHVGGPELSVIPIYLARIGFEFTVLEPPELIEQVRTLAGMFSRSVT
ncbi:MAG TPA: YafY family protein [Actinophytocola sp.]|uniref:helix-turn-helix transcriptional regulator n=1 Tax=Actinophytocola sp. TaxID=1872138 RepID=UPI002DDD3759|nr:YafY family protein [Actinophytocola sp.]HEV2780252.1 YafY family protein [Actinophytocola sp.]